MARALIEFLDWCDALEAEPTAEELEDARGDTARWAAERLEARGEEPTDEAVWQEIEDYAADVLHDEGYEQLRWERHHAEARRLQWTGAWRVPRILVRPQTRARSTRRRASLRPAACLAGGRGDPSEPGSQPYALRAAA
jgi:hypothetical protein